MPSRAARALLSTLLVLGTAAAVPASSSLRWRSLDAGTAEARETDRAMLIDFWADWCVNCAAMDADVFNDEEVGDAMQRIVPVRIDIDRKPDLARRYGVGGVPTLIVADAFGNELFRHTGQLTTPVMLGLLRELPADVSAINRLSGELERDARNFGALDALGHELRAAGLFRASIVYFERALRSPGAKAAAAARSEILIALGGNHLALRQYDDASRAFERYRREFPGGPREAEAMLGDAKALLGRGERRKAEAVLKQLSERDVSDTIRQEVAKLLGSGAG